MANEKKEFKKKVFDILIKVLFSTVTLTIVACVIFVIFFELKSSIKINVLNSDYNINCPKQIKLNLTIKTNQKSGILKYKYRNTLTNDDLFGEMQIPSNNHDSIYNTIPVKTDIESNSQIVVEFENSYNNIIVSLLQIVFEKLKESLINKKFTSDPIIINCLGNEAPEGMVFVEKGILKKVKTDGITIIKDSVSAFFIDIDEVSYWDYCQFAKIKNKIVPMTEFYLTPTEQDDAKNYPILGITWEEADQYCKSLSRRLPTVKEWEFVANGGSLQDKQNSTIAPHTDKSIISVRELAENSIGVRGIVDNAIEWCFDSSTKNHKMKATKGFQSFEAFYNIGNYSGILI